MLGRACTARYLFLLLMEKLSHVSPDPVGNYLNGKENVLLIGFALKLRPLCWLLRTWGSGGFATVDYGFCHESEHDYSWG